MPQANKPDTTSVSRRRFVAAAAAVAAGGLPTGSVAIGSGHTEVAKLYRQWPLLWQSFKAAEDATNVAMAQVFDTVPAVPESVLVRNLPNQFVGLINFYRPDSIWRGTDKENAWISSEGWQCALDKPVCRLATHVDVGQDLEWLSSRKRLAWEHEVACDAARAAAGVEAAEDAAEEAYNQFCELETAILRAPARGVDDVRIQAIVAAREGLSDNYEMEHDRAALLVASILQMEVA